MKAQGGGRQVTPPRAAYRLRLSSQFPLIAAGDLVSYLDRLGISHVCISPVVRGLARNTHCYDIVDPRIERECTPTCLGTGSTHLYDAVDPRVIDPNIGSEQDLRHFAATLHGQSMGLILDIVPNYMAATDENSAWQAVEAFAEASGHGPLRRLLEKQCYRLIQWRGAGREVNFRRLLDLNDLVGVRVEDPAVFEATHAQMLAWITEGLIDGLTIDHVDALLDPLSYLERLRSALIQGRKSSEPVDFYIYLESIVTCEEKILHSSAPLPACWPVDGVMGHDFLNDLEAAFVDPEGIAAIDTWYRRMTAPWRRWRRKRDSATLVVEAKRPEPPINGAAAAFHAANRDRGRRWPGAMICTMAHETKHSSDVRARLDVLSEIPEIWTAHVRRWRRLNRRHRRWLRGRVAPDTNTEYLLYQTLVGIWPLPERGRVPGTVPDARDLETLRERASAYVLGAAREARTRTSWMDPNPSFEAALDVFVRALLDPGGPGGSQDFLSDVARLVSRICRPGLWSALGRALIHLTAPGVPRIYQGDELWNLSLVGPDNRRPVDFEHRRALLGALEDGRKEGGLPPSLIRELVEWPEDGRIKLWTISRALGLRREDPCLFSLGDYVPLRVEGARARHLLAFTRRLDDRTALVVAPRFLTRLVDSFERPPLGAEVWRDTCLRLPARLRGSPLRNVLTNSIHVSRGAWSTELLRVADLLDTLPVALLVAG